MQDPIDPTAVLKVLTAAQEVIRVPGSPGHCAEVLSNAIACLATYYRLRDYQLQQRENVVGPALAVAVALEEWAKLPTNILDASQADLLRNRFKTLLDRIEDLLRRIDRRTENLKEIEYQLALERLLWFSGQHPRGNRPSYAPMMYTKAQVDPKESERVESEEMRRFVDVNWPRALKDLAAATVKKLEIESYDPTIVGFARELQRLRSCEQDCLPSA